LNYFYGMELEPIKRALQGLGWYNPRTTREQLEIIGRVMQQV